MEPKDANINPPEPGRFARFPVSSIAMSVVVVATLIAEMLPFWTTFSLAADNAAQICIVVYLAWEWPRLGWNGRIVLLCGMALMGITAALGLLTPEVLDKALHRAAFFALFVAALGFLRDAASTSPLVSTCGHFVVNQPPGRRYAVLTLGGHFLSILLNLGALNLLGAMIQRANSLDAAAGDPKIVAIRERRMTLAVVRTFSTMPLWSPLTLSMAVILSLIPGLSWMELAPFGIAMTALFLTTGYVLDRITRPLNMQRPQLSPTPGGPFALAKLMLLVLMVSGIVVGVYELFNVRIIVAVLFVIPLTAIVWMGVQHLHQGLGVAISKAAKGTVNSAHFTFPTQRSEVAVFSGAAVIGVMLLTLITPEQIASIINDLNLPAISILLLFIWVVPLVSLIGITPLISVLVLGDALSRVLIGQGFSPLIIGITIICTWAATVGVTPYGGLLLVMGGQMKMNAWKIGPSWNLSYTLSVLVLTTICLSGWYLMFF